MELRCTISVHPSYYNVGMIHPSIWRDAKTNPARGAHIQCKGNCLLLQVKVPVHFVAVFEIGGKGILLFEVLDTSGQLDGCNKQS